MLKYCNSNPPPVIRHRLHDTHISLHRGRGPLGLTAILQFDRWVSLSRRTNSPPCRGRIIKKEERDLSIGHSAWVRWKGTGDWFTIRQYRLLIGQERCARREESARPGERFHTGSESSFSSPLTLKKQTHAHTHARALPAPPPPHSPCTHTHTHRHTHIPRAGM